MNFTATTLMVSLLLLFLTDLVFCLFKEQFLRGDHCYSPDDPRIIKYQKISRIRCSLMCNRHDCSLFDIIGDTCLIVSESVVDKPPNYPNVRVFKPPGSDPPGNLALGCKATASSFFKHLGPEYLVDGIEDTGMFHSNVETSDTLPWALIDLGSMYNIRKARVVHKLGESWVIRRLRSIVVEAGVTDTGGNFSSYTEIGRIVGPFSNVEPKVLISPSGPVCGRYVTLRKYEVLPDDEYLLNIREFEVFSVV